MPLLSRSLHPMLRRPRSAPGQPRHRFRPAAMLPHLGRTALGLWLRLLGYAVLGLVLEDFQAAPLIWLLLLASAFCHQHPWLVQHHGAIARWSWAIPLVLLPIGMALPSWALFLTALPMGLLFASMILTAHQPLRTCIVQSLGAYGLSSLVISAMVLMLDMAGGDRFSRLEGLGLGLLAVALLGLGTSSANGPFRRYRLAASPPPGAALPSPEAPETEAAAELGQISPALLPSDLYRWSPGWLAAASLLLGAAMGHSGTALPPLALLLGR